MPKPILEFYRMRNRNLKAIDAEVNGYAWPVSVAALIVALAASGSITYQFDEKVFPVAAVEFMKREPITGNMFNNDEFGDYIIFTAWPAYRVYIDGRSDMYGEKYGGDYLKIADVQPGWKEILKKYGVSWVIFNTQSPLIAALHDQIDWQAIYSDPVATIFVKKRSRACVAFSEVSRRKFANQAVSHCCSVNRCSAAYPQVAQTSLRTILCSLFMSMTNMSTSLSFCHPRVVL